MTSYKTEQENFWSGEFGNDYITRNRGEFSIASNLALFSKILSKTHKVRSLIEFGANIGLNLQAIQLLLPEVKISAVEINSTAVKELEKMGGGNC